MEPVDLGERLMARARRNADSVSLQPVAGNGLLDRRLLLKSGMVFAGAMSTGIGGSIASAGAEPLAVESWSKSIGVPPPPYATPPPRAQIAGIVSDTSRPGTMQARSPHHRLARMITQAADGIRRQRSIPIAKAMDDAMIVFYQNGEPIMPWNGYPMRLLLPGYEGNMNVKWLRRLKLTDTPVMAINESRQYTLLLDSGKAWRV